MRISTGMQFYTGQQAILDGQEKLNRLQNQLSTGRKVLSPSDDPVAAARALLVSQSKSTNSQYMSTQADAGSQLAMTDTILGNVSNTLQSILSNSVKAGNGSYTDAERLTMATELRQQLTSLVQQANSRSASGDYVFGGYQSNQAPFSVVDIAATAGPPATPPVYASYNGDGGRQQLQVDGATTVNVTENGSETFMRIRDKNGSPIGVSMFDSVKEMIDYLETPKATAVKANYDKAFGDIQASFDHVGRAWADVGAREAMIDEVSTSSQDLEGQYTTALSKLQDLDFTEAITNFQLEQTQLQAAQQVFTKIAKSNLFDYL